MREVLITSSVGVAVMLNASSVHYTVEEFLTTSLPKQVGKTDYAKIRECHQLLTANAVLVES